MLWLLGCCVAQLTVMPPRATAMPGQTLGDVQMLTNPFGLQFVGTQGSEPRGTVLSILRTRTWGRGSCWGPCSSPGLTNEPAQDTAGTDGL